MDLTRFLEKVGRILAPIGIGAMVIMMTVVVINVLGRAIINTPLKGTVEMVEMTGAIMVSFVIAYTQFKKHNIIVGIVADRMPPKMRAIVDCFTMILSLAVVIGILWTAYITAVEMTIAGEYTGIFETAKYPFRIVWVFGLFTLALFLLLQIIQSLSNIIKGVPK